MSSFRVRWDSERVPTHYASPTARHPALASRPPGRRVRRRLRRCNTDALARAWRRLFEDSPADGPGRRSDDARLDGDGVLGQPPEVTATLRRPAGESLPKEQAFRPDRILRDYGLLPRRFTREDRSHGHRHG